MKLSHPTRSRTFLWLGVCTAASFWVLEALIHANIFHTGTFREELFSPSPNEMWMRGFTALVFVCVGFAGELISAHERKQQDHLLLFTHALEQAGDSIIITDKTGVIVYVNAKFTELTGHSSQDAIGQHPSFLKSDTRSASIYKTLWSTIKEGKVWRGILIDKRADGTLFPAQITISPVRVHSNEITHYIGAQRDISKQVALEKRLRHLHKMEALNTLAAGIGHDFNNILTSIIGHADLGQFESTEGSPAHRRFDRIQELCFQSSQVIRKLLVLSHEDPNQLRRVSLTECLAPTLERAAAPPTEGISLLVETPSPSYELNADPVQLQRVILNLITNAKDAILSEKATGVIHIRCFQAVPPNFNEDTPYLCIQIQDSGPGIPESIQERIFEPFFSTKGKRGSGFGLATSYRIIQEHHGEIVLDPSTQIGAVFNVFLPLFFDQSSPPKENE